jgi:hypothetical protein
MSFNHAWDLVIKAPYPPKSSVHGWTDDDVFCCGITPSQAEEQSWNFCPFCGTKIPKEIVASYDTIMHGHPDVEGES